MMQAPISGEGSGEFVRAHRPRRAKASRAGNNRNDWRLRWRNVAFSAGLALAFGRTSLADTLIWQGATGDWFTATNWIDSTQVNSIVPGASDSAVINNGGTAQVANGNATAAAMTVDQGSTAALASGSLNINGGNLYIGYAGTSTFTQTGGTCTAPGASGFSPLILGANAGSTGVYNLADGTLTVSAVSPSLAEVLGWNGSATFNQTGGVHNAGVFGLGWGATSTSTYFLSAGSLTSDAEYIGQSGSGTFVQSGGIHTVTGNVLLGGPGGNGRLDLSAGSLSVGGSLVVGHQGTGTLDLSSGGSLSTVDEIVGYYGAGFVVQTGGTHTVAGTLLLSFYPGSSGSYTLNSGKLQTGYTTIGDDANAPATFTQAGGTHTVTSILSLGGYDVASNGTYNLNAGQLTANIEVIGEVGQGTFTQTGGTHTVTDSLYLAYNAGSIGSYLLQGGALSAGTIYVFAGSTFTQTGGTLAFTAFNLFGGVANISGELRVPNTASLNWSDGSLSAATLSLAGTGTGNGALDVSGGNHTFGGAISLIGDATIGVEAGSSLTLTGTVSGAYTLTKAGDGILNLNCTGTSTPNRLRINGGTATLVAGAWNMTTESAGYATSPGAYSNGTLIQTGGTNAPGTLSIAFQAGTVGAYVLSGGGLSTANVYVGGGANAAGGTGTFSLFGGSATVSSEMRVYSTGSLNWSGGTLSAGTLSLAGTGTGNGALYVSAGNNTFAGKTTLIDNATIGVETGAKLTLTGEVSGLGYALTKTGAGSLTLSGLNTYTGDTIVTEGGLKVGAPYAIPSGPGKGNFLIDVNGKLNLNGNNPTINGLWGSGAVDNFTGTGKYTLTVGANDQTSTFAGTINNTSGTIVLAKIGGGTLNLTNTASSTFSRLEVDAGTVSLAAGTWNIATESIGYTADGTLSQTGGTNVPGSLFIGNQTGSHGVYSLSGGALSAGAITVNSGGTFLQAGGMLYFTTFNLSGGTASIAGEMQVLNTASLNWSGGTLSAGMLSLAGNGAGNGALYLSAGSNTFAGTTLLIDNATIGVATGATLVLTGDVIAGYLSGSGFALTKTGAGNLTLSGLNSYTGDTIISAGSLKVGGPSAIPGGPGNGNVVVNGTLNLNGNSPTINGLSGSGTVDNFSGTGTYTLTVGGNDQTSTYAGVIKNTSGSVTVTKIGAGTLNLTNPATSTFSRLRISGGSVSLAAGTWNVATEIAGYSALSGMYSNGTLNQTGGTNATGSFLIAPQAGSFGAYSLSGGALTAGNVYVGGGSTAAGGVGTFNLLGGSAVASGEVRIWNTGALNWSGGTLSAGTLSLAGTGTGNGAGALYVSAGNNTFAGGVALIGTATIGVAAGASLALTGAVTGSGYGLTKAGDGTLRIPNMSGVALHLSGGVTAALAGDTLLDLPGLTADPGAILDLGSSDLLLRYSGSDPYDTYAALMQSGGIITSLTHPTSATTATLALVDNNMLHITTWHGHAISDGSNFSELLFAYTYAGDANLDGVVDENDYLNVIANMGKAHATWFDGDLDGDGVVSVADMGVVAQYMGYGSGAGLGQPMAAVFGPATVTAVPEPASLLGVVCSTILLMRRRGSRTLVG